jgi:hypothetical protein
VRAFLDKAHEKMVTEVRNGMEDEAMLYEAISASNIRVSTAKNLLGGPPTQVQGLKSLLDLGDGYPVVCASPSQRKKLSAPASTTPGNVSAAARTARRRRSRLEELLTALVRDKLSP